jgi:hypothetical protein
MNTLIYKRTHRGDPNPAGVFGCHDCMGRVRQQEFEAVIGLGGKHPWLGHRDIAFKVTWVGIHPKKSEVRGRRGPLVRFEKFELWNEDGKDVRDVAPKLYRYMFVDQHVRHVMSASLPKAIQGEVAALLELVENAPASRRRRRASAQAAGGC